ncbi:ABC transporter permease [Solihabitans fulvus]|uniref:ABC transporter permease n=1 Tax=Solihabitans fulvus TaxID=1892852 RepID=A0A5B2X886_9PSEU|nr:ABC transporter permease [Solihabitans fulvus]KAA2259484.1 ABC transporter permease [Solihabitans fulvus]
MTAFRSLSLAMFKGFFRDKAALFFTFVFPLIFLVVFGLLFKDAGTSKIKIAAVGDGPVITALEKSGAVELEHVDSLDAAVAKVKNGDLPAVVAQQGDSVVLRFAASDQAKSGTVLGLVAGVVDQANLAATGQPPKLKLDPARVEDSSLKPIQFLTPGLLSWGLATSAVFGAALTLVNWRKKQVLRRIRLAPVGTPTVLSSRLLVSVGVAVVQAALFVTIASTPLFGLKLSGQWWLGLPMLVLGTLSFFSIGMLVGSFAKTEEAATAFANLLVLPMAFLSGTFFPLDSAPAWLKTVSNVLPLKHLNEGMLNVLVRGKGIDSLLVPGGILIGFTLVVGVIAAKFFRWEDA